MKINFKINLTESQKEAYQLVHEKENKYLTLAWSRQSGKSTLMKVLCIEWLFQNKKQIAYICRNYILAKKLYKDIIQYFPKEYIKSANGSDLTITSILGSTLTFFSAESGASLRGQTFNYLICDEFAFFNFEQTDGSNLWYDILFPTVKVKGEKVLFVSTPLGKNNIFADMYLRGLDDDYNEYKSLKKTIYDDGLVTDEDIEDIKKQIPKISFQQEFLCEFLDSSLTFFQGFENCFTQYKYNNTIPQYIGIDLSANGKDETIVTKINQNNQTEQHKIQGTLDQKYQEIANIINNTNNLVTVYIENNGIGAPIINEVQKLLPRTINLQSFTTTNDSKTRILSDLALNISKSEIYFNNEDKELFSQFSTFIYKYTKTGKLQLEAQSGHKDDRVMSLAIALACKSDNTSLGGYTLNFHKKKNKIYTLAEKYG